jgi:hypothetical protein
VQRRDGGLDQVRAAAAAAERERQLEHLAPARDLRLVPARTVLVGQ